MLEPGEPFTKINISKENKRLKPIENIALTPQSLIQIEKLDTFPFNKLMRATCVIALIWHFKSTESFEFKIDLVWKI